MPAIPAIPADLSIEARRFLPAAERWSRP